VRRAGRDGVRHRRRGCVLVVGHGEGDGVVAPRGVGVGRVPGRRGRAVAEIPVPAGHRAVWVGALIGEAAGQPAATRRERRRGRLVRRGGGDREVGGRRAARRCVRRRGGGAW